MLLLVLTAFKKAAEMSSIYGTIEPPDGVKKVMAISGRDTVVVIPQNGKFSIAVYGGIWKLFIQAIPPYRDINTEHFKVTDGISRDAGIIRLTK